MIDRLKGSQKWRTKDGKLLYICKVSHKEISKSRMRINKVLYLYNNNKLTDKYTLIKLLRGAKLVSFLGKKTYSNIKFEDLY